MCLYFIPFEPVVVLDFIRKCTKFIIYSVLNLLEIFITTMLNILKIPHSVTHLLSTLNIKMVRYNLMSSYLILLIISIYSEKLKCRLIRYLQLWMAKPGHKISLINLFSASSFRKWMNIKFQILCCKTFNITWCNVKTTNSSSRLYTLLLCFQMLICAFIYLLIHLITSPAWICFRFAMVQTLSQMQRISSRQAHVVLVIIEFLL
jgi:hypothetical protein